MIHQDHPLNPPAMVKEACLFTVIAAYREIVMNKPWRRPELAAAWEGAIDGGFISGDLNNDGNMDGAAEGLIVDYPGLLKFLKLPLINKGKFRLVDLALNKGAGNWVATAWKWKYIHWVWGGSKPVGFDPIWNNGAGSLTVQNGAPYDLDTTGNGGLRMFEFDPTSPFR